MTTPEPAQLLTGLGDAGSAVAVVRDEFDPWLAEQMRKPEFRRAYRRASRAAANDHHEAVAVKPSLRRTGWRHGR